MIIVYRKGDIRNQTTAWGADRGRKIEGQNLLRLCRSRVLNQRFLQSELEVLLIACGAIDKPDRLRPGKARNQDNDESDDNSDDDDPSSRMRSAATSTNSRSAKNIRGPTKKDDDDSDFEFDM